MHLNAKHKADRGGKIDFLLFLVSITAGGDIHNVAQAT